MWLSTTSHLLINNMYFIFYCITERKNILAAKLSFCGEERLVSIPIHHKLLGHNVCIVFID